MCRLRSARSDPGVKAATSPSDGPTSLRERAAERVTQAAEPRAASCSTVVWVVGEAQPGFCVSPRRRRASAPRAPQPQKRRSPGASAAADSGRAARRGGRRRARPRDTALLGGAGPDSGSHEASPLGCLGVFRSDQIPSQKALLQGHSVSVKREVKPSVTDVAGSWLSTNPVWGSARGIP